MLESLVELPIDVQREIIARSDEPVKRATRQLSSQWRDYKHWCTEKLVDDAYSNIMTAEEVLRVFRGGSVFILFVTEGDEVYDRTIVLSSFNSSSLTVTTVTLDEFFDSVVLEWGRTDYRFNTRRVRSISEGIRSVLDINQWTSEYGPIHYWFDPFISKSVVEFRLRDCETYGPSYWNFVPAGNGDDYILHEVHDIYILGMASMLGMYNLENFSSQYDEDAIVEHLEIALEQMLM